MGSLCILRLSHAVPIEVGVSRPSRLLAPNQQPGAVTRRLSNDERKRWHHRANANPCRAARLRLGPWTMHGVWFEPRTGQSPTPDTEARPASTDRWCREELLPTACSPRTARPTRAPRLRRAIAPAAVVRSGFRWKLSGHTPTSYSVVDIISARDVGPLTVSYNATAAAHWQPPTVTLRHPRQWRPTSSPSQRRS